ncbi:MAG: TAXI family TRAP transporter solute-binding subunit, partial [Geminicoccaceae bacterium]
MAWSNLSSRYRVLFFGVMLAASVSLTVGPEAQERKTYRLGTATTSELPHAVGVTLAALIKLKLLPSTGIDMNAQNTVGSRDNVRLLNGGDIDLAILTGIDARGVALGSAANTEQQPESSVRFLTNLWQDVYHFVVRKDLVPGDEFAEFLKLGDLRVALGDLGNSGFAGGQALFDAFGVNADEAFQLQNLSGEDAAQAFLEGELDAFVLKSDPQNANLLTFLDEAEEAASLLSVSEDDIETANGRGPKAWSTAEISTIDASGQQTTHRTLAVNHQLVAAAAVDEEVIYQITRSIFDNLPVLQGMHSATDGISLQNALQQIALPIHPGAKRYYDEIGVDVPEPEPVRISNLAEADFLTRFSTIEEARLRLRDGNISILGGQDGQTIGRFTGELANDLKDQQLRVMGMLSPDPANNIAQVLYAKGVDSAFVPLDILNYAVEENIYPGLKSKLVYTTELFPQEFHLIVGSDISNIEDLIGQPVNLGVKDSGSEFTASFLFDHLDIPVEPTHFEPRKALDLLKRGELAAVVLVAGKPVPLLQQIGVADGLRFLQVPPLDGVAYRPATITAADYPGMLGAGESIDTFGVRTALITYNWRTDNPRYATLSTFVAAFFDRLSTLQDDSTGLHPKW